MAPQEVNRMSTLLNRSRRPAHGGRRGGGGAGRAPSFCSPLKWGPNEKKFGIIWAEVLAQVLPQAANRTIYIGKSQKNQHDITFAYGLVCSMPTKKYASLQWIKATKDPPGLTQYMHSICQQAEMGSQVVGQLLIQQAQAEAASHVD